MSNIEPVFYTLINHSAIVDHTQRMTDNLLVLTKKDIKWAAYIYTEENNNWFLQQLEDIHDLESLDGFLSEQLRLFARQGDDYEKRRAWLRHTEFICNKALKKSENPIFEYAINWCWDWQENWLTDGEQAETREDNQGHFKANKMPDEVWEFARHHQDKTPGKIANLMKSQGKLPSWPKGATRAGTDISGETISTRTISRHLEKHPEKWRNVPSK